MTHPNNALLSHSEMLINPPSDVYQGSFDEHLSPLHLPTSLSHYQYQGTANLTDRSRSPSLCRSLDGRQPMLSSITPDIYAQEIYSDDLKRRPRDLTPRHRSRKVGMPQLLPSPTTLHDNINFPKLNQSPSKAALEEEQWREAEHSFDC